LPVVFVPHALGPALVTCHVRLNVSFAARAKDFAFVGRRTPSLPLVRLWSAGLCRWVPAAPLCEHRAFEADRRSTISRSRGRQPLPALFVIAAGRRPRQYRRLSRGEA